MIVRRLLRPKRVLVLGLGFLLGSRAGRAPWEKAVALTEQLQGKAQSKLGVGRGSGSPSGVTADLRDPSGALT